MESAPSSTLARQSRRRRRPPRGGSPCLPSESRGRHSRTVGFSYTSTAGHRAFLEDLPVRVSLKSCGVFAATLFLAACSSQSASTSLPQTPNDGSGATTPMMSSGMRAVDESRYGPDVVRGCPLDLTPGMMTCQVLRNKKHDVSGYGPPDIQSAYNLPSSTNGTGVTVAIADAFGYPTAESDLAAYRSNYGLPVCSTQERLFEDHQPERQAQSLPAQRWLGSNRPPTWRWFRPPARTATSYWSSR